jgi:high affinity Mn2+ porin
MPQLEARRKPLLLLGVAWIGSVLAWPARAAEPPASTSVERPGPDVQSTWTGFHLGAQLGYAGGHSSWSATEPGSSSPTLSGSLHLFNSYDAFKGTGSYLLGLNAGYDHTWPSRLLLGAEADVWFPSLVAGSSELSSPLVGRASYAERMQLSGTVRGRVGYALDRWLLYATGGFAWSYDEFTRTQLAGTPVGGTAQPGDREPMTLVPRIGGAAGAGVELALTPSWTARLEYLYSGYGSRSVYFPAGAQRFDSSLAIHRLSLGLDYRFGRGASQRDGSAAGPPALDLGWLALHGQTTYVQQYAFPFPSPYVGQNSLRPNQTRETWDVTFFAGFRLWEGAELWVNPEIDQGFGLSSTLGVAGFPSGAAFKVGQSVPYARIPRTFIRQAIDLGGEVEKVEADLNQLPGSQTARRLVITLGKFSLSDVFDANRYSENPRKDFMNWALIDTGTFDYAADAWGFTYGAAVEWYLDRWTLRGGWFDLSIVPNSTDLDPNFGQFQWVGELEGRWTIGGRRGKAAVTGILSRGRMGRFEEAIQLATLNGGPADIAAVRRYTSRGALSFNLEQEIAPDLGAFARAGVANGEVEPFDYTDVDRTVAVGVALGGARWERPGDTVGFASVVNWISRVHQAFLDAGGLGILVGDGKLPSPGAEVILETYYGLPLPLCRLTLDYQLVVNPAYNRDRGPVSIIGARLHAQF